MTDFKVGDLLETHRRWFASEPNDGLYFMILSIEFIRNRKDGICVVMLCSDCQVVSSVWYDNITHINKCLRKIE